MAQFRELQATTNLHSGEAAAMVEVLSPSPSRVPAWRRYVYQLLAREISTLSRYYDKVVQWQSRPQDSGLLLKLIDCPSKDRADTETALPDFRRSQEAGVILVHGNFNHHLDVQGALSTLHERLNRHCRVVLVAYNPYFRWLYRWANALGLREGEAPCTFLTRTDLTDIAGLAGFEILRTRPAVYMPWRLLGLGALINRIMPLLPLLRWLSLTTVITLRPRVHEEQKPSLSIIIPARNERGNIQAAIDRMPDLGCPLEIIFVEGHSVDGTWETIQQVIADYKGPWKLKVLRQTGKGKNDAVRVGFAAATGDLLTILDADLTMPPELLERFYVAYTSNKADFVSGSRLVYPMENDAMRFLNHLGNVFFAKSLSFVLDVRIGDSLCGTKLFSNDAYQRMVRWRKDFGDFDPFGDFELLFPAAVFGLGIANVPVRYRARTYGSTNIRRFRDGLKLLQMTLIGFWRIKAGVR